MAVSYPLSFPTGTGVADITFSMKNARSTSASPFTGRKKMYKWPLQVWQVDIVVPRIRRDRAEEWVTFLAKLNAGVSTDFPSFYLSDPNGSPLGTQATDFRVNDGGDPNTVLLSQLDSGKANALAVGDYIRIGEGASSRLHKVLDTVDADASGNGQASIWPATYQNLDNTKGSSLDAYGVFSLTSANSTYNIDSSSHYNISFSAESLV